MSKPTLLQQMQQVQALQLKIAKYHKIYTEHQQKQSEENQFLNQDIEIQESKEKSKDESFRNEHKEDRESKVVEEEEEIIYESKLVNTNQEEIRLSRIFQDIVIGDQLFSTDANSCLFQIKIDLEGTVFPLQISKKQLYSLSNFSSFNNKSHNSVPQTQQKSLEFSQLLHQIQEQTGRCLTRQAIEKIIIQITETTKQMKDMYRKLQQEDTKKRPIDGESRYYTGREEDNKHKFDTTLNNCAFHRTKNQKQRPLQSNHDISTSANRSLMELQPDHYTSNKEKTQKHPIVRNKPNTKEISANHIEEKENRVLMEKVQNKGKNSQLQKQMKIMGRGKDLVMNFADQKQIQCFCISNKIMGKDKEKLVRAVNANKSCIRLE